MVINTQKLPDSNENLASENKAARVKPHNLSAIKIDEHFMQTSYIIVNLCGGPAMLYLSFQ